jgi:hypothetical protein
MIDQLTIGSVGRDAFVGNKSVSISSVQAAQSSDELFEQILELLQNYAKSAEANRGATEQELEDLQKKFDAAKTAKAEDRRKITLAVLQGLASGASIVASLVSAAAKIFGGTP